MQLSGSKEEEKKSISDKEKAARGLNNTETMLRQLKYTFQHFRCVSERSPDIREIISVGQAIVKI
jgi:hypothetical protein